MSNTSPPSIEVPEALTNDTPKGQPPVVPPPTPSGERPQPVLPRPATDGADDVVNAPQTVLGAAPVPPPEPVVAAEVAPQPVAEHVAGPVPQVVEPAPELDVATGRAQVPEVGTKVEPEITQPLEEKPIVAPVEQPPVVEDVVSTMKDKPEVKAGAEALLQEIPNNVSPPATEEAAKDLTKPLEAPQVHAVGAPQVPAIEAPKVPAEGAPQIPATETPKPAEDTKMPADAPTKPVGGIGMAKDPQHPTRAERKAARKVVLAAINKNHPPVTRADKIRAKVFPNLPLNLLVGAEVRDAIVFLIMEKARGTDVKPTIAAMMTRRNPA